jgi:cell division transport system ATP-binding protein
MNENSENSLIRMFHVYRRYGSNAALFDINLEVFKNELMFITGPSGAGKSTLLKLLYLGEPVSEGQIIVDGINLSRISRSRIPFLRRKIGIIFQDFKLIHSKTVFENISLVLEAAGKPRQFIQKKVASVLRAVGMDDKQNSFPLSLSGGEQQRIAIARAVAGDPTIILADEPTGSLDAESANQITGLLKEFHIRGSTVIVATHDKELISKSGGRAVYLKQGRIEPQTVL